ncbi:hypothetical protein CVT24_012612 [Panaeolus cyanescens]|uniref:Uncharacterized protein n=1 Tax=Panaeolus cyanescens TaxID=181874 RepID=A0A409WD10_9AGAR|nr:hypothetical protein CVT24_012612 [Panaeolus cyanescens]
MEPFGPEHPDHRRVPWPREFEKITIDLPTTIIGMLTNNVPISGRMKAEVQEFGRVVTAAIDDNNKQQFAVKEEVKLLKSKLVDLKSAHQALHKKSFASDVISSPFRKLPNDILYEIVTQIRTGLRVVPEYDLYHIFNESPYRLALTMAGVCKSMRYVTRSKGKLWNYAKFTWDYDCRWKRKTSVDMSILNQMADLTHGLPIAVELFEDPRSTSSRRASPDFKDRGIAPLILRMVTEWPAIERLASLDLGTSVHRSETTLFRLFVDIAKATNTSLASLKALSLKSVNTDHPDTVQDCGDFLQALSGLQHLSIFSASFIPPNFPGERLKTLRISSNIWSREEFVSVFQRLPNLEAAKFGITQRLTHEPVVSAPNESNIINHRCLQELDVHFEQCYHTIHSELYLNFVGVRFPALKKLRLSFSPCDDGFSISPEECHSLLLGMFPAIEVVHLIGVENIKNNGIVSLFPLLRSLPTITELYVSLNQLDTPKLTGLLCNLKDGGDSLPFPKLKTMLIGIEDEFDKRRGFWEEIKGLKSILFNIQDTRMKLTEGFKLSVGTNISTRCRHGVPRSMEAFFVGLEKKFQKAGMALSVYRNEEEIADALEQFQSSIPLRNLVI